MVVSFNDKRVFAFSDTHGRHRGMRVPEDTDILICAGDVVEDDLKGGEYDDFISWYSAFPAKWKLFVPGNHELSFDVGQSERIVRQFNERGVIVLQDAVEDCDGVVIGSISGNSLIADRDIPNDLDILVTHFPPYGVLDEDMGTLEILNFVLKAQPGWHLFGHIHSTGGQEFRLGNTLCRNISVFNEIF